MSTPSRFKPGDKIAWHCPAGDGFPVRVFYGVVESLQLGFARIIVTDATSSQQQTITVFESQLHPAPVPRKSGGFTQIKQP